MTAWLILLGIAVGVPASIFTFCLCRVASDADRRDEEWDYLDRLGQREGVSGVRPTPPVSSLAPSGRPGKQGLSAGAPRLTPQTGSDADRARQQSPGRPSA